MSVTVLSEKRPLSHLNRELVGTVHHNCICQVEAGMELCSLIRDGQIDNIQGVALLFENVLREIKAQVNEFDAALTDQ